MCRLLVEVREMPLAFTAERAAEFFAARPDLNDVAETWPASGSELDSVQISFYSSSSVRRGRWSFDQRRANEFRRNCGHKAPRWWEGRADGRKTRRNKRESIRFIEPAERINLLDGIDQRWSTAH